METIKKNINKIVIVIVLIFVGTFAYNYIKKEETSDVVEVVVNDEDAVLARQIIEALNELERIDIQYDFFTEDLSASPNLVPFLELFDFSEKDLRGKEIGKNNPFLFKSSSFQAASAIPVESQPVIPETVVESIVKETVVVVPPQNTAQSEEVFEATTEE